MTIGAENGGGHDGGTVRRKILYVGAHPDEFINEVGVACLLSNRYDNVVVDLTHGERGCPGWGMAKTKEVRTCEENAACAALGFGLHMLDGIDGELWKRTDETAAQLAELFKKHDPVAVFLQYPVDRHLDHMAAFTIGRHALRDSGIKPQVFLMNYRSQTSGFQPDYIVDISAHIEAKKAYCRTHVCQYGDDMAQQYADESAAIGAPFGMKYAEEYMVFDVTGNVSEWNKPSKTILDEIGLRLPPCIRQAELSMKKSFSDRIIGVKGKAPAIRQLSKAGRKGAGNEMP